MSGASFGDFLLLGIRHIFTGYDHLFFLFGLLLVCTRGPALVAIVSGFTLGHSVTLALATFGLINLPPRLTEPLIALTIFYVGAENFWRRGEPPRGRWLLVLLFGLVHGFGFASVLHEVGVGADGRGVALPLFGFNLGVEIGQLGFAALLLPLLRWLHRQPGFARRGGPALSVVVAAAGLYWFVERTVLA
jgi:hypothetical protein